MAPKMLTAGLARRGWFFPMLVAVITLATFLPAVQNGFVNWDDGEILLNNPHYRGLKQENLLWIFSSFHMGHYTPLAWLTLAFDYLLWGMNPAGYHLTNILFHAANAFLFYFLSLSLLKRAFPAYLEGDDLGLRIGVAFATLFFSVHPLRVEVVAWVTARRDLVGAFFFLLTLLAYLKACAPHNQNTRKWFWLSIFFYGFSLLSKATAVGLPFLLILLDVYPLRRLGGGKGRWLGPTVRSVWIEKIPFLVLGAAVSGLALFAAGQVRGSLSVETWGVAERASVVAFALGFYLWKTVFPLWLSPLYELPQEIDPLAPPYLLSTAVIFTVTCAAIILRNRWPALFIVLLSYLLLLLPVGGLFQTGPQLVADRYTYLSSLGWIVLIAAGIVWSWRNIGARWPEKRALIPIAALFAILVLQVLTVGQISIWRDSIALWSHAVDLDPRSTLAHNNLAAALLAQGRIKEATHHLQQTVRLVPSEGVTAETALTDAEQYFLVGVSMQRQKQFKLAETYYTKTINSDPAHYRAWNNLGVLYAARANFPEALEAFIKSLRIKPLYAPACKNGQRAAKILERYSVEIKQCLERNSGSPGSDKR